MAIIKYTCPPQSVSGQGTFADDLVGLQLTQGGGLTQGNFAFTTGFSEKSNREFSLGAFSEPITLETLNIESVEKSKAILEKTYQVFPNFDLSEVSNFSLYGSLAKRFEVSINKIIRYFPAALQFNYLTNDYTTGYTAINISYNQDRGETYLELNLNRISNPFEIEYTTFATRNLELREIQVSNFRNLTTEAKKYVLDVDNQRYPVNFLIPSNSATTGVLKIYVKGNPFSGEQITKKILILRPSDYFCEQIFTENFDEVENFLLNRLSNPIYTATFQVPKENDSGNYYIDNSKINWPLYGLWNLDIVTPSYTNYIESLANVAKNFDEYKTNTIVRFLTTDSFKEFDTDDQKMTKTLEIYGRSFDEVKKFVDALAYMNSVNYNIGNDIPSQLLKNLAQTLGWNTDISPITNDQFLSTIFDSSATPEFEGFSRTQTPDELNFQYFRNLILNSSYLFKSKGTRKSIEGLLRLIGAPEALIEFNENIYIADQRINMNDFNRNILRISGGTYISETPSLDPNNIFRIRGVEYTGFTTTSTVQDVNISIDQYPVDSDGYPKILEDTETNFFQKGSGWFEQTPQHRGLEVFDNSTSVFTGSNPSFQTYLEQFTYGQKYLNTFRKFPYTTLGYNLYRINDNNKSWTDQEIGLRRNTDGLNAYYYVDSEKQVLNVKNVDLFMNVGQGLAYDVWYLSSNYNYPIPSTGLTTPQNCYCPTYLNPIIYDRTQIDPNPSQKTFFEFAQTFWRNMINTRDRQFITDGKTGGYATLQFIYWRYLQSGLQLGVPNNQFTYQKMIDYVNGLGDYWIRLVEQMIPATTIWNTGIRYENSIFHKQKFVWRRQRGCQLVPVVGGNVYLPGGGKRVRPCNPCVMDSTLFYYDCPTTELSCKIYPWDNTPAIQNFGGVLNILLNNYLNSNGYSIANCDPTSITTEWYLNIKLNGNIIVNYKFFDGVGLNSPFSSPTSAQWLTALNSQSSELLNYGLNYLILNNNLIVSNLTCDNFVLGNEFELNVGINFDIACSK